jgi:hypothetical protein
VAKAIATVGGIALAPGISRNRRRYTSEAIAGAVERAQKQIGSGDMPLTMRSHHQADDDSVRIVGRISSMSLAEDGSARFTGEIADTAAGRDIASLMDTTDGRPAFLSGVSIRGSWLGVVKKVTGPDGEACEEGSGLEIFGVDYTASPGVPAAQVDTFAWSHRPGQTETTERVLITESVQEARVSAITEETTQAVTGPPEAVREALAAFLPEPAHLLVNGECMPCSSARGEVDEAAFPMGKRTSGTQGPGGPFADPGYQADKKPRYQLDSKLHAKAAYSYISQKVNAAKYTGAQLKRVKGRIIKACKSYGVSVAAEGWTIDPAWQVSETVREYMGDAMAASGTAGSWCIRASNGPVSIDLSSYCMDPADLDVILRAAAGAACDALAALDPDMDGDVDVAGVGRNSDPGGDAPETAPDDDPVTEAADETPAEAGQLEEEEPPMTETATVTPAAEAAPAAPTADVIAEAVRIALAEAEAARTARKADKKAKAAKAEQKAAEQAPAVPAAVTETGDQRIARLVEERSAARIAAEVPQVPVPVAETEEARIARMVEERVIAAKQELMATGGGPSRKGLVDEHTAHVGGEAPVNSHGLPAGWPDKELHTYSPDELAQFAGPVLDNYIMKGRAVTDVLA